MTNALEARNVTKRFRSLVALSDCTLDVPAGHVVGLVGPNGAGKSTLLNLAAGLLSPSEGSISILGETPNDSPEYLAQIGFVAQDHPIYSGMSVKDHLRIGSQLNPLWDMAYAQDRIKGLGLNVRQRAGQLSGGQRAQLSITMALAKRPQLLLLDEPVASLDPLARHKLLEMVMGAVAEQGVSVILSSHLVGDVERVCDFVVMLVSSHLVLSGEVDEIVASHHRLVGRAGPDQPSLENQVVIDARSSGRQITAIVRSEGPVVDARWIIESLSLEDIVLAYMGNQEDGASALQIRAVS